MGSEGDEEISLSDSERRGEERRESYKAEAESESVSGRREEGEEIEGVGSKEEEEDGEEALMGEATASTCSLGQLLQEISSI
jgi:hypothetical protein